MYGKLARNRVKLHKALGQWTVMLLAAVLSFGLLIAFHSRNIPSKWVTAIMGTIISFSLVVYAFRKYLLKWQFWAALVICLTVHTAAVWTFFEYALTGIERLSIWAWFPAILGETVLLLIAVKRIQDRLTGRRERIKLSL